jgi:ribosomal protein L29
MKRNDITALHTLSHKELSTKHNELMKQFAVERIQHKAGRLKKTSVLKTLRDDIARVKTIMHTKVSEAK